MRCKWKFLIFYTVLFIAYFTRWNIAKVPALNYWTGTMRRRFDIHSAFLDIKIRFLDIKKYISWYQEMHFLISRIRFLDIKK